MNSTTPKISPLRQRMIEDMRLRKLATQTQSGYILCSMAPSVERVKRCHVEACRS
jgi:hypothetical protein